jgi:large subunit ribosomal protein L6
VILLSRIGKQPINIPNTVEFDCTENVVKCKGPKGELSRQIHRDMMIEIEEGRVQIKRPSDSKFHRSLHGLTRTIIANMVDGVSLGFSKKLEIVGVGYKAEAKGKKLLLTLGYSHPILMEFPESIKFSCPSPNEIIIEGVDKDLVGLIAAKIRSFRKPEPYKGKGVKYAGEHIRRKAGKTGA